jgi:hypothetical protein
MRRANGKRFLGNTNTREVHDLDNEETRCQIGTIIRNGHARFFDTLSAAKKAGYDNCHWCLGDSKR